MTAMLDLAERLETARAADSAMDSAETGDLLRLVPRRRAIFRGRLGGRAVVFRMFLNPQDDTATREWQEMQRIWPEMRDGPYRIAEPLYHAADHQIVVVEEVRGTPLLKHLWRSAPGERERHLRPCAQWLRHYTESSETWTPAGWSGWLARAERAAATQPFPRLRNIESGILDAMQTLGDAIGDGDWRVAISHGDFHPNNLILNGARLTGIDTGGSGRIPLYKDMARLLVHMGRRGLSLSGESWLGVDRHGFDAFAETFGLSETERNLCLPFMIAFEALIRVETPQLKSDRIDHAAQMYDALQHDLRTLAANAL